MKRHKMNEKENELVLEKMIELIKCYQNHDEVFVVCCLELLCIIFLIF